MKKKAAIQRTSFDWIEASQAYDLLNMDKVTFRNNVGYGLTISSIGKKKYYRLSEINQFLEENIIMTQEI